MYAPKIEVFREWRGKVKIWIDDKELEGIIGYELVDTTNENYIEIKTYEKSEYGYMQKLTKQYPINFLQFTWIGKKT